MASSVKTIRGKKSKSKKKVDIDFLGWSTNDEMINFRERWQKIYNNLSEDSKKIATMYFLSGIYRAAGAKQRYVNHLPPLSKRKNGITLLEPSIIEMYGKEYEKVLSDEKYRKNPKIIERSNMSPLTSFIAKKCK